MNALVSYELLTAWFGSPANGITPEGGLYGTYINNTGADSVKGTIVQISTDKDNAVEIATADSAVPIGVIYEDGAANGSPVKVVVYGKAQVLLNNNMDSYRGYWCGISDTPGRMIQSTAGPETLVELKRQIGHSLESKSGGTDILALVQLNFI